MEMFAQNVQKIGIR